MAMVPKYAGKGIAIILILSLNMAQPGASATPSTIIWIPSTDIQGYGVWHLGIDNYFSVFKKSPANGGIAFPTDLGLTVGVLPWSGLQLEIGTDILEPQDYPWLFNAKVGTPEGSIFPGSPAIVIGVMNIGLTKNINDYDVAYGVVSKNISSFGRCSFGAFSGSDILLVNPQTGARENTGFLVSWDKQVTELSDKLWLAMDYQSGKSGLGAVNVGFGWTFSQNVSLIAGYDLFNNDTPDTFTTQLDINL